MATMIPYRNTPRGIGADGTPDVPSTYEVVKLDCISQSGAVFDISPIVVSMTITEELYSPIIVLNLRIRDNINFFEDFAINGQERIEVKLKRFRSKGESTEIDLSFNVKEYPNFQKTAAEPNIQEYNVIAVSEFAYKSMLSRISRSVKGNPIDNISKIFVDDLGVQTNVKGVCVSTFDGIVTIQSPLKAVEWLRTKAFDYASAPFFVYSCISSPNIQIASLSDLWAGPVFRTFQYRQHIANVPGTENFFNENAIRVLDMNSSMKLDKLRQATNGGFANKTTVTDYATKTFTEIVFDYSNDDAVKFLSPNKTPAFSAASLFDFGAKKSSSFSLNNLGDASITNLSTNSSANYKGNSNASGVIETNISRAKSYYANLEGVSHNIQVYGDFDLNPGTHIKIEIPKAVNVDSYDIRMGGSPGELDKSLSGDYLVAVAAHSFKDGLYSCKIKIIKDA